ncbi:Uncharacterised protein [Klebsiella pneumoniae]|nr:Uncharacterised protein [Klebsiella pneumoniae]
MFGDLFAPSLAKSAFLVDYFTLTVIQSPSEVELMSSTPHRYHDI